MKGWYEDYKDLRRDMIRQNLDEIRLYEEDRETLKQKEDAMIVLNNICKEGA